MARLDPRVPNGIAPAGNLPMPVVGQRSPTLSPDMAKRAAAIRQAAAAMTEDGGALLTLPGPAPLLPAGKPEHDENLAEQMEEDLLGRLSAEIDEGVDEDILTNEAYFDQVKAGIELMGLKNEAADDPFDGASGAVHPMLLIALIRFVAECRGELQPADGPAKVKTEASPAQAVAAKANRKQKWLNYYLTVEDRGYYRDCDAGWLQLGLYGSIFRKVYDDPVTGNPRSRFLTPLQLIVSWHAPDLESAHRITHVDTISTTEAVRRQLSGYYRQDVEFRGWGDDDTPEREARERDSGRTPGNREEDAEQVHMHSHVLLAPAEWGLPEEGPEGLPLPFIVTRDKRTAEILRIERDWFDGDPHFRRRDTYAHYIMHPGLGFYGWSLLLMMANTTNTASTLWRQAINTFMLHTHPGGLRVKGMRPEQENLSVGPGEYAEVDTGGMPINQAIMPLPYRDIPGSFPPLFETVLTAGQTLGGTQELQVGEGRQDAPVGTTIAMLEAAIKPTAAVFKRLHEAQGDELRMLAKRFARDPKAKYPYLVDGQRGMALAADFQDVADIVPVSDPNIPTQTQRLAQAQATLQLALSTPGVIDTRAAVEDMLVTMGRSPQEIERLMPKPGQGEPSDVTTEFAMALKGMPLAVGPAQDHEAHIRSHLPILQTEGIPPNVASALMAHIGEHAALWYRLQGANLLAQQGIQLPPPGAPLPPEIEAKLAQAVAANATAIMTQLGGMLGGVGDPAKMAEIKYKYEELRFKNADSQRKALETARQDQTELLKLRQQSMDEQADRELRREELDHETKQEVLKGIVTAGKQHQADQAALTQTNRQQLHDWETGRRDQAHTAAQAEAERGQKTQTAVMGHIASAGQQHADQRHQAAEGERARQHEAKTGEAQRGHEAEQAFATQQASDAEAAAARAHEARMTGAQTGFDASESDKGRKHEATLKKFDQAAAATEAAAEREHQVGIAAMGHDAALTKQKMAGETTLKAAKLKPKPAAGAKPKARKT